MVLTLDLKFSKAKIRNLEELLVAQVVFLPHNSTSMLLQNVQRVDVVWDCYLPNSLKTDMQLNRGTGSALLIRGSNCLPSNRKTVLRVDSNKSYKCSPSSCITTCNSLQEFRAPTGKVIVSTCGDRVVSSPKQQLESLFFFFSVITRKETQYSFSTLNSYVASLWLDKGAAQKQIQSGLLYKVGTFGVKHWCSLCSFQVLQSVVGAITQMVDGFLFGQAWMKH